jgi:hypothetical protein
LNEINDNADEVLEDKDVLEDDETTESSQPSSDVDLGSVQEV